MSVLDTFLLTYVESGFSQIFSMELVIAGRIICILYPTDIHRAPLPGWLY